MSQQKTKKTEAVASGAIKVTQVGSPIARDGKQRATLIGLGLNKIGRTKVLADNANVRGMITKVAHLIKVEAA